MAQQSRSAGSSSASPPVKQQHAGENADPITAQISRRSENEDIRYQAKRRRQELQQRCLRPSGLVNSASLESRIAAWLHLLGISQDDIAAQVRSTSAQNSSRQQDEASSVPGLVKESLSSPIPLDKDGWQVASDDMLGLDNPVTSGRNGKSSTSSSGQDIDGWKVVKSKKTKRRKGADTESDASPPESPSMGDSLQTSTITSREISLASTSPTPSDRNADEAPSNPKGLGLEDATKQSKGTISSDQVQYPNLSARDVEQVAKDVERSFIGPAFRDLSSVTTVEFQHSKVGSVSKSKQFRRKQLSYLVLTTLSRHPALHYFQGYHDILSVILLTLAPQTPSPLPEDAEQHPSALFTDANQQALLELVAERISLHLIRDNMTRDLLPVMGQLKLLGNLIRLCDPTLADLVDRASPLPFFALPWLLTLLTHDAVQISVMQHVLEFVIAFGPKSAIYLCAAILLEKKEEVLAMDPEELEDPAMLHTILARLPTIIPDRIGDDQGTIEDKDDHQDGQKTAGFNESSRDVMYVDPDVELPSLASDRELATASAATSIDPATELKAKGLPISSLLQKAAGLMERYPLQSADVGADEIMGSSSVLFTWESIFDPPVNDLGGQGASPDYSAENEAQEQDASASSCHSLDWATQNSLAEKVLKGPTDAIVRDPHPPPPTPPASDFDEKHPHSQPPHHHLGKRRGGKAEWEQQAKMFAVVGISGLLVAALIGVSQNPGNAASSAATLVRETTSEETKRVLTLIVSLLSNWGRVVGSGG